jgi:hypothetical protein
MKLTAAVLCHPSSKDLIDRSAFEAADIGHFRIACGASRILDVDYSEASDFFPSYASWNSALFETSVILTIWEHADEMIGDGNIAVLHSDVTPHFDAGTTWSQINSWIDEHPTRSIGLVVPDYYSSTYEDWLIPESNPLNIDHDPMWLHAFDNNIFVWDFIKKYDFDIYQFALDTKPRMIYSHQFACSRAVFDNLGFRLYEIAHKIRLQDVGFWTAHMFERLIGLYLAKINPNPLITTAFWHHCSSKSGNLESMNLYGPRALKHYKIASRAITGK